MENAQQVGQHKRNSLNYLSHIEIYYIGKWTHTMCDTHSYNTRHYFFAETRHIARSQAVNQSARYKHKSHYHCGSSLCGVKYVGLISKPSEIYAQAAKTL